MVFANPMPLFAVLKFVSRSWQRAALVLGLVWDFFESDSIAFATPNTASFTVHQDIPNSLHS